MMMRLFFNREIVFAYNYINEIMFDNLLKRFIIDKSFIAKRFCYLVIQIEHNIL